MSRRLGIGTISFILFGCLVALILVMATLGNLDPDSVQVEWRSNSPTQEISASTFKRSSEGGLRELTLTASPDHLRQTPLTYSITFGDVTKMDSLTVEMPTKTYALPGKCGVKIVLDHESHYAWSGIYSENGQRYTFTLE